MFCSCCFLSDLFAFLLFCHASITIWVCCILILRICPIKLYDTTICNTHKTHEKISQKQIHAHFLEIDLSEVGTEGAFPHFPVYGFVGVDNSGEPTPSMLLSCVTTSSFVRGKGKQSWRFAGHNVLPDPEKIAQRHSHASPHPAYTPTHAHPCVSFLLVWLSRSGISQDQWYISITEMWLYL